MLIEIRAKNCFVFQEQIIFSMKADMRNKKFATNVYKENNFNILKVAGIYGPNNSGKTCLIRCIRAIRYAFLNNPLRVMPNFFTNDVVYGIGVTFLHNGREFSFDFDYNSEEEEYISERFTEITKDQYGNEKETVWFERNYRENRFYSIDRELDSMMELMSKSNLICYLLDTAKFRHLKEMKEIISSFAKKIDIINVNDIPIKKTIELMKNENDIQSKVVGFIKNADLYMDDFRYEEVNNVKLSVENSEKKPEEKVLDVPENIMEQIGLTSVYRGVSVPSIIFDSTGTKKIVALASYIIEGLEQGRILAIDELDSGIHFKLTRAIVAMFNNELNFNSQLIFTVHDTNLMDCKRLFRKEQIWFVHKDNEGVYVYSLADFTAQDGVRGDSANIDDKYRKGVLGALPNPEFINTMLDLKGNR